MFGFLFRTIEKRDYTSNRRTNTPKGRLKTTHPRFQTASKPQNAAQWHFINSGDTMPPFAPPVSDMKKSPAPKTFEEAIKRLETLTQSMQNSEMPLEEALAAYQEGNELVKYCRTKLAEVEQKLQVLDADGLKELTLDADE